jgi:DNA repair exonuclease SbcCD ATPase subunit
MSGGNAGQSAGMDTGIVPAGFSKVQKRNEQLNEIARRIRHDNSLLETIHDYIAKIKSQLERIVKNYPPFPPGSEERIRILRSVKAFRSQIDQLTVPPVKEGSAHTSASGPVELSLPNLHENSTDAEVRAAVDDLASEDKSLEGKRKELAENANRIANSPEFRGNIAGVALTDLAESSAEEKSVEVRESLAVYSGSGLTNLQIPLNELLR